TRASLHFYLSLPSSRAHQHLHSFPTRRSSDLTTEHRLEEIEQEMVEASSDYAKVKELNEEQQNLNTLYEDDITRWSELEELKERSEEHTSELQSRFDLVCRLLLEKKKKTKIIL